MQIFENFNEPQNRAVFEEMLNDWNWTDFEHFWSKYGSQEKPEEWRKFMIIFPQFERMGMLVKDGLISPEIIYEWMGGYPIRLWDKFEPVIAEWRTRYEAPPKGMWMEWFEDLVYALRNVRKKDRSDFVNRLARRQKLREELDR
jgi:hypothetical protein